MYEDLIDELIDASYNSGYYAGRCVECDEYVYAKYTSLNKLEIEKRKNLRKKLINFIEKILNENNTESL